MAPPARIVVSGLPHHVTQRGNRRQPTFFNQGDYARNRSLLAERAGAAGIQKIARGREIHDTAIDAPEAAHSGVTFAPEISGFEAGSTRF